MNKTSRILYLSTLHDIFAFLFIIQVFKINKFLNFNFKRELTKLPLAEVKHLLQNNLL